jgi:hypothetical protein
MTKQEDEDFVWITSDYFGEVRLQHYNDIVEFVDDGRFRWAIGKSVSSVLDWVKKQEDKAELEEVERQRRLFTLNQEREMLWDEEQKKLIEWRKDHWVCGEGGDGYYDPR